MLQNNYMRLIIHALRDATGYPKSDANQKYIGYSLVEIDELYDKVSVDPKTALSTAEKQIILNCIDGAIHYVNTDIPALYDMSEKQLAEEKVRLEEAWGMKSTFAASRSKNNICVVCGFHEIKENYLVDGMIISTLEICPSCGFQYGYSNFPPHVGLLKETRQLELVKYCRDLWIQGGMRWGWSFKHQKAFDSDSAPQNWNPLEQLKNVPKEFLSEGERY